MKIKLKIEREFEAKYVQVCAYVRYWEDADVNGTTDEDGTLIPCKKDDAWEPTIHVDTGQIINWSKGVIADIHYKVCDAGYYELQDLYHKKIASINGYVPSFLCPTESGYGDYIIMKVDRDGFIEGWNPDLNVFNEFGDD